MKKLILLSLIIASCTKPQINTTSAPTPPTAGTFTFNNVNYTPTVSIATQNGNTYSLIMSYQPSSGTISDLCQVTIAYNPFKKDSSITTVSQIINGNANLYVNNAMTGKKDPKGNAIAIYEYKKNPNIIKNANNTFTINDSFKCFIFGSTKIDTTRYTLYINNITTQ